MSYKVHVVCWRAGLSTVASDFLGLNYFHSVKMSVCKISQNIFLTISGLLSDPGSKPFEFEKNVHGYGCVWGGGRVQKFGLMKHLAKFRVAVTAKPCEIGIWLILDPKKSQIWGSLIAPLSLTLSDPERSNSRSPRSQCIISRNM